MDTKQRAGAWLIGLALLLAVAALGWWTWENSDSRENERQTDALTAAMSGDGPYEEPEPNAAPAIVLGAFSGVLLVCGVLLVALSPGRSPTGEPGASDRP